MKKNIALFTLAAAIAAIPASTFAATYEYVTVNGTLSTVTADNATAALAMPADRDAHSGVLLIGQNQVSVSTTAAPMIQVMPMVTTTVLTGGTTTDSSMTTAASTTNSTTNTSSSGSTTANAVIQITPMTLTPSTSY